MYMHVKQKGGGITPIGYLRVFCQPVLECVGGGSRAHGLNPVSSRDLNSKRLKREANSFFACCVCCFKCDVQSHPLHSIQQKSNKPGPNVLVGFPRIIQVIAKVAFL